MDSLARISLWNMAAEAAGELSACLEEARDRRKRLENAAAVVSPCRWRCLHLDTWPMARTLKAATPEEVTPPLKTSEKTGG